MNTKMPFLIALGAISLVSGLVFPFGGTMSVFAQVLMQGLSVIATVFFTSQLVENDNSREERAKAEKVNLLKEKPLKLARELLISASQSLGAAQIRIYDQIFEFFPSEIVFEAYENLLLEAKIENSKFLSMEDFKLLLKRLEVKY